MKEIRLQVGKMYKTISGGNIRVLSILQNPIMDHSKVVAVCRESDSEYESIREYPLNGQWLNQEENENTVVGEYKKKHPLLNQDSKHYDTNGDKPAIYYMEQEMTTIEMLGFCTGNIFKYEARKEKKGSKESDEHKMRTYKAYKSLLLEHYNQITEKMTVRYLLDKYDDIEYEY